MENSTKALIMGGGIFIGILILSIFAYTFSNMGVFSNTYSETIENQNLDEFNSKFNIYANRELNIQDVVTIINLAQDYNSKNEEKINIKGKIGIEIYEAEDKGKVLSEYLKSDKKFKCELEYNSGKVSIITISEIKNDKI